MKKSDIIIKSTNRGYISMHFWAVLWFVGFYFIARWAEVYMEDDFMRYGLFPWPPLCVYGSYAVMCSLAAVNIYAFIYFAMEVGIISYGKNGFLEKVSCRSYGFPFSKHIKDVPFNRIIDIEVSQGSIDRLLNTGSLTVNLVTFTSADALEKKWEFTAISDPMSRKKEIEEAIADHEGLLIKLKTEQ